MKKLILLFSFSLLSAELSDHLKKAEGKSSVFKAGNIDFIYMINLDRRPDRYLKSCNALVSYGIIPYRFSAVDGHELSLETLNDVGLQYEVGMTSLFSTSYPFEASGQESHSFMNEYGKTYFSHFIRKGGIACYLSHLSVLQDAYESGYETIWVLEDDIDVIQDPSLIFSLINKLDDLIGKNNWDVLFTDQDFINKKGEYVCAYGMKKRPDMDCSFEECYSEKYTFREKISSDFQKISARFGTHSMIIRRSGVEKLLKFYLEHKIYLPYDMENYLVPNLHRYALCYDVVTNLRESISDIALVPTED